MRKRKGNASLIITHTKLEEKEKNLIEFKMNYSLCPLLKKKIDPKCCYNYVFILQFYVFPFHQFNNFIIGLLFCWLYNTDITSMCITKQNYHTRLNELLTFQETRCNFSSVIRTHNNISLREQCTCYHCDL